MHLVLCTLREYTKLHWRAVLRRSSQLREVPWNCDICRGILVISFTNILDCNLQRTSRELQECSQLDEPGEKHHHRPVWSTWPRDSAVFGRKLGTPTLFSVYILIKLVFQFAICTAGILASFNHDLQFSDSIVFKCTNNSTLQWPLSTPEILCSDSELSSVQYLRWFNLASLIAIMLAITCGVIYLCFNWCWLD